MKKIAEAYKKLKIQNKILITYVLFIMCPMLCFFGTVNYLVTKYSREKILFSAGQAMEQTQLYLGQYMYNVSQLLNTMFWDADVKKLVLDDYSEMSMTEQYRKKKEIETYIGQMESNNNINGIRIYMPSDFMFIDEARVRDISSAENWCDEVSKNGNSAIFKRESEGKEDYVTIGRLIKDDFSLKYAGAIKIYVNAKVYDEIANNCVSAIGGMCYIINSNGEIIAQSEASSEEYYLSSESVQKLRGRTGWTNAEFGSSDALVQVRALEYSDWSIVNVVTWDIIRRDSKRLTIIMIAFMLLISLIAYCLAFYISKAMVSRIVKLNKQMMLSRNNEFKPLDIYVPPDSDDEIDMLSVSYNGLIHKIESYAALQAENSRAIKSAELKALQEQINPHFLYNILDLINWLSIKKENGKITVLLKMLTRFYKIGLHNGREIMPLSMELEHTKLYMEIQKIRFRSLEDLVIDVPEELNECMVQKNMLMPLVENAINHGIRGIGDIRGIIYISAAECDGCIVLTVKDNGRGIPQDIISALKSDTYIGKAGHGFGIHNLNERIRLYYGTEYGVEYGDCECGATVSVRIPKIMPD